MKIKPQFVPFVFGLLVAAPLSALLTLANLIRQFGLTDDVSKAFFPAFLFSFIIAYPTALIVVPQVRKIMAKIS